MTIRLATPRVNVPAVTYPGPERRSADRRQASIVEVRPTYAHIDTAAMIHNLRTVGAHVGPRCRILAVVKADGYGHGAIEAARVFVEAGAWGLAVSLVEEGVELRQAGILAPVLVLGGVHPGSEDVIVHRSLTPVVWARDHLQLLAAAVRRSGAPPLPVHVKVDTGMSRLGMLPGQLPELLDWFESDEGHGLRVEIGWARMERLQQTYADVKVGEMVALVGSSGRLEVAVREGSAAERLQLKQLRGTHVKVSTARPSMFGD